MIDRSKTESPVRIAVTGHSGFVGRWFMRIVGQQNGYQVLPFFEHPREDISDGESVKAQVMKLRPDIVLHLASIASPAQARAERRRCFEVNFGGTLNLAEALLTYSPHTYLIFIGSSEAYGETFNESPVPLKENAVLRPISAYGASKAAADLLVGQMVNDGLKAIRMRPFNHTGPEQTPQYVVPTIARQIAKVEAGLQPPILQVGNIDAARDFLDVRDVVAAYELAIRHRKEIHPGAIINVCSGQAIRIGSIISNLLDMSPDKIIVSPDSVLNALPAVRCASGDASVAAQLLNWAPKIPLDETLRTTLNFWRSEISRDQNSISDATRSSPN